MKAYQALIICSLWCNLGLSQIHIYSSADGNSSENVYIPKSYYHLDTLFFMAWLGESGLIDTRGDTIVAGTQDMGLFSLHNDNTVPIAYINTLPSSDDVTWTDFFSSQGAGYVSLVTSNGLDIDGTKFKERGSLYETFIFKLWSKGVSLADRLYSEKGDVWAEAYFDEVEGHGFVILAENLELKDNDGNEIVSNPTLYGTHENYLIRLKWDGSWKVMEIMGLDFYDTRVISNKDPFFLQNTWGAGAIASVWCQGLKIWKGDKLVFDTGKQPGMVSVTFPITIDDPENCYPFVVSSSLERTAFPTMAFHSGETWDLVFGCYAPQITIGDTTIYGPEGLSSWQLIVNDYNWKKGELNTRIWPAGYAFLRKGAMYKGQRLAFGNYAIEPGFWPVSDGMKGEFPSMENSFICNLDMGMAPSEPLIFKSLEGDLAKANWNLNSIQIINDKVVASGQYNNGIIYKGDTIFSRRSNDAFIAVIELSEIPVFIKNQASFLNLQVFPNPATDRLWVEGAADGAPVALYAAMGQLVRRGTISGGGLSLAGLSSGLYLLQVHQPGGTTLTARVAKE
ncbi:MAG: T9SS type A sorting domain-containing protein [Bacteroidetes bacterium]|jgi:hypothetical protein|nr:T9SS type A sorting domain-containing protein [Bacteroidota bacterium]